MTLCTPLVIAGQDPPAQCAWLGSYAALLVRQLVLATLVIATVVCQDVTLQAPLTTVVPYPGQATMSSLIVHALVVVPADAPNDLGVGAYAGDRHGRWFQECRTAALMPGRNDVSFTLTPHSPLLNEPDHAGWDSVTAATTSKAGLFFWSASASHVVLHLESFTVQPADGFRADQKPAQASASGDASLTLASAAALKDLHVDGFDEQNRTAHAHTGERWTLQTVPSPMPENPYDGEQFMLDAVFTATDGSEQRVPGFYDVPMQLIDRGDIEVAHPDGPGVFEVRYRPREPGRYRVRLEARWHGSQHEPLIMPLPDLDVAGPHWDGYVHVDARDPRFFSVDDAFYWPVGLNLNSTYDHRSHDRLDTKLTPDRGSKVFEARLRRFAAAGGNAVEIWMSSWNLALEWRREWPGYEGMGRYNQGNAARLDAILDTAWSLGVRVNLVINNHGQAASNADREWKDNPYNKANGGPLDDPYQIFVSPVALAGQEQLRRYLIARYADHPAVLGWKLWSEINLTAGAQSRRPGSEAQDPQRADTLRRWHEQAAARWHALDIYGHGVTTHWSGDYRTPEFNIVALPGLDYICIDAYINPRNEESLLDVLFNQVQDPVDGLGQFKKPILATEYGGSAQGATPAELEAELASAPWAAMMGGNGGAPMLWWFEWVDQSDRWSSFAAIKAFLANEDMRGGDAHASLLSASSAGGELWARAWTQPGHMLGYIADSGWADTGDGKTVHDHAQVLIGTDVPEGPCQVQWWDANKGILLQSDNFVHQGGVLELTPPAFTHHIAFKLSRRAEPALREQP